MFGWEGALTRLVPLDIERHFENAMQWMNDPDITAWLLVGDLPITRAAEREYFERMATNTDTEIAFAIETLSGEHIGFSGLHQIAYKHGTAISGSLIGRKELWGKGFGTDAARTRARYAFEVLGLRQLFSSTLEGNERSLRMQQAVGYEVWGIKPKALWKRGMYRDEIMTVLAREKLREG